MHTDGKAHMRLLDSWDGVENVHKLAMLSWDVGSLAWVKFTGSAGGGGGGAATIADGADVTQGAKGDAAWDGAAASASGVSIWKALWIKLEAIRAVLAGTVTVGGSISVSNFPGSQAVTGPLTDTQLRLTAVPVSGPLTDTQIRATPLPVSGPLTDTQLRATAVPVSGPATDAQIRAAPVPVSGPLTDTQLRATAVPVSGSVSVSNMIAAVETGLAKEATTAKDATLAQFDTDFKAAIGSATDRPAAYTELDRLYQLGLKIDKGTATMQQVVAALAKPVPVPSRPTLLHRM